MKTFVLFDNGKLVGTFTNEENLIRLCNSGAIKDWVFVETESDVWPPVAVPSYDAVDIKFSDDNKHIESVVEYESDHKQKLPKVDVAQRMVTLATSCEAYKKFKYYQQYEDLLRAAERRFPHDESANHSHQ